MKIAGVVCEYNPFHNGHALHLNATRAAGATHIVAVMSGNFVQRGEGAFCDKFTRAKAAVQCGADLVLDLPVPFSCAGAESFARGAISLLDAFGIDLLSFGAETKDVATLRAAAGAAQDNVVRDKVRFLTGQGIPFPAALQQCVAAQFGDATAAVLSSPNNTLAVEYLKAAAQCGAVFDVFAVQRQGALHDSPAVSGAFASASTLRKLSSSASQRYMPAAAFQTIYEENAAFFDEALYETAVLCALRGMTQPELAHFVADESGLADRLFAAVKTACSLEDLYMTAKTKSVTLAKVRRAVLRCFLGLLPALEAKAPPYLRVLAVNERGLELLSHAAPKMPLVTKHAEMQRLSADAQEFYALQCRTTDLYTALCKKRRACSLEQTSSMLVLK